MKQRTKRNPYLRFKGNKKFLMKEYARLDKIERDAIDAQGFLEKVAVLDCPYAIDDRVEIRQPDMRKLWGRIWRTYGIVSSTRVDYSVRVRLTTKAGSPVGREFRFTSFAIEHGTIVEKYKVETLPLNTRKC